MKTTLRLPEGDVWECAKLERNWMVFRVEYPGANGKANKVPCNARGGYDAATEMAAFMTFEQAVAAREDLISRTFEINARFVERGTPDKQAATFCAGYLARPASAFVTLDLDEVISPSGNLANWVPPLGETYTEVSTSGFGLHMLTKREPGDDKVQEKNNAGLYAGTQRGIALTFEHIDGTPLRINGASSARQAIYTQMSRGRDSDQGSGNEIKVNGLKVAPSMVADRRDVPDILDSLPNPANGRDEWVRMAHACKAAALEADAETATLIEEAFIAWSERGEAHGSSGKSDSPRRLWDSIETVDSITPGTFYYFAKDLGWTKPQMLSGPHTSDGFARANAGSGFDLSHDALTRDLGARSWDLNAKYVATWGKWLFWTGTRWEMDERLRHMTEIRDYLSKRSDELAGWAERKAEEDANGDPKQDEKHKKSPELWARDNGRTLRSKATVAAVADLARSNPASVASVEDFDANLMLLGTPGGVVELRTGTLRQARREDMMTKLTACAPAQPGVRPERWLTFLGEIFNDDHEVVDFMQRAAGYALTGETREHKLLFLYGTGRNGKSVFLNTLMSILADYARRVPAATFLHSNTERHPTDIAGLHGARLAIASELPKGKTWDESTVKDLTGGDRLTARRMRQDFFDFDPQLTLMIAGNNMPSFRGVDEAIRARVVLVPFTVTIPPEKRDTGLYERLQAEAPAILRWAIDGTLAWQKRGLDVPASIAAASADYFDEEDTVKQFIEDEAELYTGAFTSGDVLAVRFTQWCEHQGLHPWTKRTLMKELRSRGFEDAKSNGYRGLRGLRLRT